MLLASRWSLVADAQPPTTSEPAVWFPSAPPTIPMPSLPACKCIPYALQTLPGGPYLQDLECLVSPFFSLRHCCCRGCSRWCCCHGCAACLAAPSTSITNRSLSGSRSMSLEPSRPQHPRTLPPSTGPGPQPLCGGLPPRPGHRTQAAPHCVPAPWRALQASRPWCRGIMRRGIMPLPASAAQPSLCTLWSPTLHVQIKPTHVVFISVWHCLSHAIAATLPLRCATRLRPPLRASPVHWRRRRWRQWRRSLARRRCRVLC